MKSTNLRNSLFLAMILDLLLIIIALQLHILFLEQSKLGQIGTIAGFVFYFLVLYIPSFIISYIFIKMLKRLPLFK